MLLPFDKNVCWQPQNRGNKIINLANNILFHQVTGTLNHTEKNFITDLECMTALDLKM